jgi:hypothetical protein
VMPGLPADSDAQRHHPSVDMTLSVTRMFWVG